MKLFKMEAEQLYQSNPILKQIAYWHNLTPKLWRKNHQVSDEAILSSINKIISTPYDKLYLCTAYNDEDLLIGYLWAHSQHTSDEAIMILSLYVTENMRSNGVATELKAHFENWCTDVGIKEIQTTVHYKNKTMIRLNQKLGYEAGMVTMSKDL
jgi:GNAT superfamily N-acetyltransferase